MIPRGRRFGSTTVNRRARRSTTPTYMTRLSSLSSWKTMKVVSRFPRRLGTSSSLSSASRTCSEMTLAASSVGLCTAKARGTASMTLTSIRRSSSPASLKFTSTPGAAGATATARAQDLPSRRGAGKTRVGVAAAREVGMHGVALLVVVGVVGGDCVGDSGYGTGDARAATCYESKSASNEWASGRHGGTIPFQNSTQAQTR
mmetsp:Transcript_30476/g.55621  ORF Transcript_30476/g.55621 Transcript_30476/m.55621 type:complete len:202 (-) Transcript_30476:13-618(-)